VHRTEQRLVEDRGLRGLGHRGVGAAPTYTRIGARHNTLRLLQTRLRGIESAAKGFGYIEHTASVGIADGRVASAVLREYELVTAFFYGFGLAIAIAMALAIGNTWVRDHRNGVWTVPMVLGLLAVAIVVGITIGWALVQYFAFYTASATGRT
jgi:hypothetical protein